MKEVDDEDSEVRVSSASLGDLMRREAEESPSTTTTSSSGGVQGWQPGEVEVEDRWGISFDTPPIPRSGPLGKSKSRQLLGSRRSFHRVGRRVFSCFRHSTISLTIPELEPSTPPKSGPLTAPRKSASGANSITFLREATDHRHHGGDDDQTLESEEPTSPVVNCMGQVRTKQRSSKKIEPKESFMDDRKKFRRTKSQAPKLVVPMAKSCKWKQLRRSSSSSISPSNQPYGSELGEPEIDLGRFSFASASHSGFKPPNKTGLLMRRSNSDRTSDDTSKPLDKTYMLMRRSNSGRTSDDTSKPPDKTYMLMRRTSNSGRTSDGTSEKPLDKTYMLMQSRNSGRTSDDNKLLDLRNAESEPVFRALPSLKTARIESPKWLADETLVNKRQGFCKR